MMKLFSFMAWGECVIFWSVSDGRAGWESQIWYGCYFLLEQIGPKRAMCQLLLGLCVCISRKFLFLTQHCSCNITIIAYTTVFIIFHLLFF